MESSRGFFEHIKSLLDFEINGHVGRVGTLKKKKILIMHSYILTFFRVGRIMQFLRLLCITNVIWSGIISMFEIRFSLNI